jgi:hypothetical protein
VTHCHKHLQNYLRSHLRAKILLRPQRLKKALLNGSDGGGDARSEQATKVEQQVAHFNS